MRTTVLATEIARPKTMPADQPQPKATPTRVPSSGRDEALTQGAGHGHPPHGEQLLEVEVQADAEHQQDDADLGELVRQVLVGDEARRLRPDDEAGEEVADDGREAEAERHVAADEGRGQAARQRQDQIDIVHEP